jgi:NADH-quinone oxidoreductase subunit E
VKINFDKLLLKYKKERSSVIPILQEIQEKHGYLSKESFKQISNYLDISENEIYGVATFYSQFKFNPPAKYQIRVCLGTACHVCGSDDLFNFVKSELKIKDNGATEDNIFSLDRVACLGACALAPVMVINKNVYGRLDRKKILKIIKKYDKGTPDYFTV